MMIVFRGILLFLQKFKAEKYDSDEEDDDFDKLDSGNSEEEASYGDDDDYSSKKQKSKKKKTNKAKGMKIGKKRKYDDVRKFVDMSAESSNEEDVEFQRDKKFQYYKAGELTQKTKGLDLQDMEERARKAAEHEQMRQIAIENGEEEDVISEEYDSDVFSDSGAIVEKFGP